MEKREMFETLLRATWEVEKVLRASEDDVVVELMYDVLGSLEIAKTRIERDGEE